GPPGRQHGPRNRPRRSPQDHLQHQPQREARMTSPNPYLQKLHAFEAAKAAEAAKKFEQGLGRAPTKPTEVGFGSFVGGQGRHVSKNSGTEACIASAEKNQESTQVENRQNRQNLEQLYDEAFTAIHLQPDYLEISRQALREFREAKTRAKSVLSVKRGEGEGVGGLCTLNTLITPPSALQNRFGRFDRAFTALEARCPDHVPAMRWQHAVEDGRRFLATWGEQAEALAWTARHLFALHHP